MRMQALFSTDERERIIRYLLENPSEEIGINALARKLNVSPSQVHKYVSLLRESGIAKGMKLRDVPLVHALRLVDNLRRIERARIVGLTRKNLPGIRGMGIYGGWADGSNTETSDLDIWIRMETEPDDIRLAGLRKALEGKIGVPVDILVATPERLGHLRKKSESLYHSLYHSIKLWGEGF